MATESWFGKYRDYLTGKEIQPRTAPKKLVAAPSVSLPTKRKPIEYRDDWLCDACGIDDRACKCCKLVRYDTKRIKHEDQMFRGSRVRLFSYEDGYKDGVTGAERFPTDSPEYITGYLDGEGDRAYA